VIDADGSTRPGAPDLPDYTGYYTQTLTALGISHDVWDADAHPGATTLPEAVALSRYKAIILQTGDNYLATLTQLDLDALTSYANDGGPILAFGQDLSSVVSGATASPSFFYQVTLGAEFLQDSINAEKVFTDTAQLLTGVPTGPYRDMNFDISARGDGADNQGYVDEVGPGCNDPDTATACPASIPLLQYGIRGNDEDKGYVALATMERATLERPEVMALNKTMLFGFGLEGVNNDTGFDTREELLGAALHWAWDRPTVTITAQVDGPGRVTLFTAAISSEFGGKGVTYRWDFGDGTGFTNPYTSATVGHTYAKPGRYTVRVEATNELGTTVIAERVVTIGHVIYLPIVVR
jgi:hypothetical protein